MLSSLKPRALAGIRALEFGVYLAVPYAAMMLATLGAQVIKVEGRNLVDPNRPPDAPGGDTTGFAGQGHNFDNVNAAKLGITLNVRQPTAVALVKRLVAISDIVLVNFRPGVMDKLGLGYGDLRQVKQDIIMLSLSGSGTSGPERDYRGYAGTFGAQSGLAEATGYPDGIPTEFRRSVDMRCGVLATVAVLAALNFRQRTGRGQVIDFAAREGMTSLIGDLLMDHAMNGRDLAKQGNRDGCMAPHNCYPCRDEGRWVSIAVATDEEWQAFCRTTGHPEWAVDERFRGQYSRWQNQDELDSLIAQWTKERSPREIVEALQQAGVAAMPSMSGEDAFHDPHLRARGFWLKLPHTKLGECDRMNMPWKLSRTPAILERASPLMGEHNAFVLGELLGLTAAEISALEKEGVLD